MDIPTVEAIQLLQHHAASLLVYQSVMAGPVGQAFLELLHTLHHRDSSISCLRAYGNWFIALATQEQSWQEYLLSQMLQSDNPFTQQAQLHPVDQLPPALVSAARQDLRSLRYLYTCTGERVSRWVQEVTRLDTAPAAWEHPSTQTRADDEHKLRQSPLWVAFTQTADWESLLPELAQFYRQSGVGLFAQYLALQWQHGALVGIAYPDPIRLTDLVGYESQKALLVKNTEALLAGYPALHMLLYGGRGTGKSSLVKAMLSEYGDRGLRLIEVSKADLVDLATIANQIRHLPQKFILFVDDLSFEEGEDAYKALKVVLEGNVSVRPQNLVVYATSNRRHLIREFFGDRPPPREAEEIHAWDTVQEKLSFSDRFGLTLTFEPADQNTYLAIVRHLAAQSRIELPDQVLQHRALQWATRHNGRSGRTARQFVDFLSAELELSTELEL